MGNYNLVRPALLHALFRSDLLRPTSEGCMSESSSQEGLRE